MRSFALVTTLVALCAHHLVTLCAALPLTIPAASRRRRGAENEPGAPQRRGAENNPKIAETFEKQTGIDLFFFEWAAFE